MKFTFLAYTESLPKALPDILAEFPCDYAYCVHNKDVDKDGNLKKEHIHVVVDRLSLKQVKQLSVCCGSSDYAEQVRSEKKMFEYLTHENNPDKYHYSVDDIVTSDDFVICKSQKNDYLDAFEEVCNTFVDSNHVPNYFEFCGACREKIDTEFLLKKEYLIVNTFIPYIAQKTDERKCNNDLLNLLKVSRETIQRLMFTISVYKIDCHIDENHIEKLLQSIDEMFN